MAYGTLREENKVVSASNIYYNAPEKLYWEYGFGIENIGIGNFRPIRVDFIWRSSFNDRNGVKILILASDLGSSLNFKKENKINLDYI